MNRETVVVAPFDLASIDALIAGESAPRVPSGGLSRAELETVLGIGTASVRRRLRALKKLGLVSSGLESREGIDGRSYLVAVYYIGLPEKKGE